MTVPAPAPRPAAQDRAWPEQLTVAPIARAWGAVALPGSKSMSNRALLLAALAQGTTELAGLLEADDTRVMVEALRTLGIAVQVEGTRARVQGCAGRFAVRSADLHLGNAGTAMRPLVAALAFAAGRYRLDGVARMRERPIGDLVDALRSAGARISYLGQEGFPPLLIEPGTAGAGTDAAAPAPDRIRVRASVSSQFLSGLLMAAPSCAPPGGLRIEVAGEAISKPYVAMTVAMMRQFGARVRELDGAFVVEPGAYRSPGACAIEGDASGASYFLALGAIAGGPVRVRGVGRGSLQGDLAFAQVLESMGAVVRMGPDWVESEQGAAQPAPAAGAQRRLPLQAIDLDATAIPDAAMTAAVLALFARGTTRLRGIGSWRVKETDRIEAMARELGRLGAQVRSGADWIEITAPAQVREAQVDTYDDHRMAMCLSLAAAAGVPVHVRHPGCVAKTFPGYFDELGRLCAPVIAIDGPTASGKGTVAQRVAAALGFACLDSGALYRIVGVLALERGVDLEDGAALARLADGLDPAFEDARVRVGSRDLTEAIRTEEAGRAASRVAVQPQLRAALLELQRRQRRPPGLVADGRDMGTVVFPEAGLKVFLEADVGVRAERRLKQLMEKGYSANLIDLLQSLRERDERDRQRTHSPLQPAQDARVLDTSALTADEVVAQVLAWFRGA